MSIVLFKIDGESFDSLTVTSWKYSTEILDGEGSGRMATWDMFREPKGVIKNIEMDISIPQSDNPQFIRLLSILDSFGKTDFRTITFLAPTGNIVQSMYSSSYSMGATAIRERNGEIVSYWDTLRIKFIAKSPIRQ